MYGAVDELMYGKWTVKGETIHFEEQKNTGTPFIAYGRANPAVSKGKNFIFKEYAQHTGITFGFGEHYAPDLFKLLNADDQSSYSHTNRLSVVSRPSPSFFLAKPVGPIPKKDSSSVYQFTPAAELNDFILYYDGTADRAKLAVTGILKDNVLYINEERFGAKEELAQNFKMDKYTAFFNKKAGPPDSLSIADSTGTRFTYQLVEPARNFNAVLQLPGNEAYFKTEESRNSPAEVTVDNVVVPVIAPAKTTKKKAVLKKGKN